jgi:site-specific DNA-cytosine methylase
MKYEQFLQAKLQTPPSYGFDISDDEVNPILKPHQRDIVRWAVKRGRAAIFAAFGLGKTVMQLECARIQRHPDGHTIPGAADGPRYKSIGNGMALVFKWIGDRLHAVEIIAEVLA